MWDFRIQTDHVIEARRLDLVVVDKKRRACKIIDFVVPRIEEKEKEKIEKYQDLRKELQKIRNVRVKIISSVVGSLGNIPKQISPHFPHKVFYVRNVVPTGIVQSMVISCIPGGDNKPKLRKMLTVPRYV